VNITNVESISIDSNNFTIQLGSSYYNISTLNVDGTDAIAFNYTFVNTNGSYNGFFLINNCIYTDGVMSGGDFAKSYTFNLPRGFGGAPNYTIGSFPFSSPCKTLLDNNYLSIYAGGVCTGVYLVMDTTITLFPNLTSSHYDVIVIFGQTTLSNVSCVIAAPPSTIPSPVIIAGVVGVSCAGVAIIVAIVVICWKQHKRFNTSIDEELAKTNKSHMSTTGSQMDLK